MNFYTKQDVLNYFGISEPTLNRWLMQSRRGLSDFPLPICPKGCKLRWRQSDIENWNSQIGNTPPTEPAPVIESPAQRNRRAAQVARELAQFGINTGEEAAK